MLISKILQIYNIIVNGILLWLVSNFKYLDIVVISDWKELSQGLDRTEKLSIIRRKKVFGGYMDPMFT